MIFLVFLKHSKTRDKKAITYHYDVSNDFYRLFLGRDMAGCSYGFEKGNINVYQVLLSKNSGGFSPVLLTREDLYQ